MTIVFQGKVVDPDGKPRGSAALQGCVYDKAGRLMAVASGSATAQGTFSLAATKTFPDSPQPRVAVRIRRGSAWVLLTAEPVAFQNGVADFGTVRYVDAGSHKIGSMVVYGDNRTPVAAAMLHTPLLAVGTVSPTIKTAAAADVTVLQKEVATMKGVQAELQRERNLLQMELQAKENLLLAREREVDEERSKLIEAHKKALQEKESEIARLRTETETLKKKAPGKATLDEIAFSSGAQIQSANARLAESRSGIRLGKVSLDIKGVAEDTGNAMSLPAVKEIGALGSSLSTLHLEFIPTLFPRPGAGGAKDEKEESRPKAPPLLDLTERAARERLEAEAIACEVFYQDTSDPARFGRVIHQSPAPGAALPDDRVAVTLIVGRRRASVPGKKPS